MLKKSLLMSVAGCGLLLAGIAGCSTSSEYVDANDINIAVKNKERMSSSDWVMISEEAGKALLSSPLFAEYLNAYKIDAADAKNANNKLSAREKLNAGKPLLMLSTIQNNTSEHIDTKLMTERLRETLFNSGKVRFTTYSAGAGQSIDAATADARNLANDPNVKQQTTMKRGTVNAYDLSLSGSIIKQTAKDGRSNELSYMFTLTLTDNVTGEGVWTYTKELKRQHKDGIFGL